MSRLTLPPVDIADRIDNSPVGALQVSTFALCLLCLIMDGFDVQALGYVAPAIIAEWKIAPALLGPVFAASNFGVLAGQGLSPTAILDLTSFLLQALIAFLGVRAAAALATAWSGREIRLGLWLRLAGVWACAFAPVLGWKLGAGHLTLVTGMLPFLAALALVVAASAGTKDRKAHV